MEHQLTVDDRITTIEAARLLGVSRMTVHRWLEAEKLPYAVISGRRVLFRSLIEEWLKDGDHGLQRVSG